MLELVWIAESVVKGNASPRPLVLLGDFWRPILELAVAESSRPSGAAALRESIRRCSSASEAVRLAAW
jgi:hypothetical protein